MSGGSTDFGAAVSRHADPIYPYSGYVGDDLALRPIPETFSFFARHNGYSTDSAVTPLQDIEVSDSSTPTRIEYPDREAGTEVVHYRIENGGHIWP